MITEELRNRIKQIKLRFTEIGEQLERGINSGNAIVATQNTLLAMIENAEDDVKASLADFVEGANSAMEKTKADLEKAELRLNSVKETNKFLESADEATLVSIYHLLVVAGLEQPVKQVYEDLRENVEDEQLTLDFDNCAEHAIENVEEAAKCDEETTEVEEHEVVQGHTEAGWVEIPEGHEEE